MLDRQGRLHLHAYVALALLQLVLLQEHPTSESARSVMEEALRTCQECGGREHIMALLLQAHTLMRCGGGGGGGDGGGGGGGGGCGEAGYLAHSEASDCIHAARLMLEAFENSAGEGASVSGGGGGVGRGMWLEEGKQPTRGLWKYLALLTAMSSLASGNLQGVPQALEQVATVEQRYGQHKEMVLAGEEEEMMWWRWDGGCEVVWCYIRSVNLAALALQAPNAGQHSIANKGTAFAAAIQEVKRGLALLHQTREVLLMCC